MEVEKSVTERLQKPLQVLAISLSIAGIFFYIIGYAYYWGALEVYDLSPSYFPLEFDSYIAAGFLAILTIFNNMTAGSLGSILTGLSPFLVGYFLIIVMLALLNKYTPRLEGVEISMSDKLLKPLEKLASFFFPVKEIIFAPYLIMVGYLALFVTMSLLLVFPIIFFQLSHSEQLKIKESFNCNNDTSGCTVIETKRQTFTGKIVASDKSVRVFFDGAKLHTIQTRDVLSETHFISGIK